MRWTFPEWWYGCKWLINDHDPGGFAYGKCFKDVFTLMLNGIGYELNYSGQAGRFFAKDAPWLYGEQRNDLSGNGSPSNKTGEYWVVRLPDGTVAQLGYPDNSEQVTDGICNPLGGTLVATLVMKGRGRH